LFHIAHLFMAYHFWWWHEHRERKKRKHAAKGVARNWDVSVPTVLKYKTRYQAEAKKFVAETRDQPAMAKAPELVEQVTEEMLGMIADAFRRHPSSVKSDT
jgi:hypothetical protein